MREQPLHFEFEQRIKELRKLNAELLDALKLLITDCRTHARLDYAITKAVAIIDKAEKTTAVEP